MSNNHCNPKMRSYQTPSESVIYPLCKYEDGCKEVRDRFKVRLQESKESLFMENTLGSLKSTFCIDLTQRNPKLQPQRPGSTNFPNPKDLIKSALDDWKTERESILKYHQKIKQRQNSIRMKQMIKAKSEYKELKAREKLVNQRIRKSVSTCQSGAIDEEEAGTELANKKKTEKKEQEKPFKLWNLLHRPMALLNISDVNEAPNKMFAEIESAYANVLEGVRSSTSLEKIENVLKTMDPSCRIKKKTSPLTSESFVKKSENLIDGGEEELQNSSISSGFNANSTKIPIYVPKVDLKKEFDAPNSSRTPNKMVVKNAKVHVPIPEFLEEYDSDAESVTSEEMKQMFNYNPN